MKICRKCKLEKSENEFAKRSEGYLKSFCKECDKKYHHDYNKQHHIHKERIPNQIKICHKCGIPKNEIEFSMDGSRKDGLRDICKQCDYKKRKNYANSHPEDKIRSLNNIKKWVNENKDRAKEAHSNWRINNKNMVNEIKRKWRHNNKDRNAFQQFKDGLKRKYNLTIEEFNQMVISQNNKCAICGHEMNSGRKGQYAINVDHIHGTKIVRSLLCNCCNKVIGYAYENIDVLKKAIVYLETHSGKITNGENNFQNISNGMVT